MLNNGFFYHITAPLEERFSSVEDAKSYETFIEPGSKHKHPWLNGFCNNLNSSEEEIPWCFLQQKAE